MSAKCHRVRFAFAFVAMLGVLALFVLDGAASGVAALATMLGFILVCIEVLRGKDADDRRSADRTGLAGWFGGWF